MALPYTKVNWQDGVTPENASTLGQMDQGIKDLDDAVQAILAGGTGGGVEYENDWAVGATYQAGDVVKYGGVEYLAVNPSTGQTPPAPAAPPSSLLPVPLVTALPASPFDGQEVILTDSLTAPTYAWRLRYVAAKASNRWLFIGGTAASSYVATTENSPGTSYAALATSGPSFTNPVAGDYLIRQSARVSPVASSSAYMSYDIGATGASDADALVFGNTGTAFHFGATRETRKSLAASTALVSKYKATAGTPPWSERLLTVIPIAVGG